MDTYANEKCSTLAYTNNRDHHKYMLSVRNWLSRKRLLHLLSDVHFSCKAIGAVILIRLQHVLIHKISM